MITTGKTNTHLNSFGGLKWEDRKEESPKGRAKRQQKLRTGKETNLAKLRSAQGNERLTKVSKVAKSQARSKRIKRIKKKRRKGEVEHRFKYTKG